MAPERASFHEASQEGEYRTGHFTVIAGPALDAEQVG